VRRRLVISGRVQGVWYRDWMVGEARRLGVAGWVRNRADGSVEALIEGEDAATAALCALAQEGPPAARVDAVEVSDEAEGEPLHGFHRRPTE
jgi:acylphosphatase